MTDTPSEHQSSVDRLIGSYNAKDFADVRRIVHPDVTFIHHATMALGSAEQLLNLQQGVARIFPDREWTVRDTWSHANTVTTQTTWRGTAEDDLPNGRAKRGQRMTVEFCSVFTFDDSGRILRWEDYGTPVIDDPE